MVNSHKAN